MKRYVIGNWKMNGMRSDLKLARVIVKKLGDGHPGNVAVMVCPPFTLIREVADTVSGGPVLIGAQDCHAEDHGAFTGDISAPMLRDAGAGAVILGHSERRHGLGETDALIRKKVSAAARAGLMPIICVGETESERDAGDAKRVVTRQVTESLPESLPVQFIVAYEPVWAIGTGRTPTGDDIADIHDMIRETLASLHGEKADQIPILYGGSVKPNNAAEILALPRVDGALVGGASLDAEDFLAIIKAMPAH